MKSIFYLLIGLLLSGCAKSGYNPSYIISDTAQQLQETATPPAE
jgi:hypothetical protein